MSVYSKIMEKNFQRNKNKGLFLKESVIGLTELGKKFKENEGKLLEFISQSIENYYDFNTDPMKEKKNFFNISMIEEADSFTIRFNLLEEGSSFELVFTPGENGAIKISTGLVSDNLKINKETLEAILDNYANRTMESFEEVFETTKLFTEDFVSLYMDGADKGKTVEATKESMKRLYDVLTEEFNREIFKTNLIKNRFVVKLDEANSMIRMEAKTPSEIEYMKALFIYSPMKKKFEKVTFKSNVKGLKMENIAEISNDNILSTVSGLKDDLDNIYDDYEDEVETPEEFGFELCCVDEEKKEITIEMNGNKYNYNLKNAEGDFLAEVEAIKALIADKNTEITTKIEEIWEVLGLETEEGEGTEATVKEEDIKVTTKTGDVVEITDGNGSSSIVSEPVMQNPIIPEPNGTEDENKPEFESKKNKYRRENKFQNVNIDKEIIKDVYEKLEGNKPAFEEVKNVVIFSDDNIITVKDKAGEDFTLTIPVGVEVDIMNKLNPKKEPEMKEPVEGERSGVVESKKRDIISKFVESACKKTKAKEDEEKKDKKKGVAKKMVKRTYKKESTETISDGIYDSSSEEYKELDGMDEAQWAEFVNEMSDKGVAVEYDLMDDTFKITSDSAGDSLENETDENDEVPVDNEPESMTEAKKLSKIAKAKKEKEDEEKKAKAKKKVIVKKKAIKEDVDNEDETEDEDEEEINEAFDIVQELNPVQSKEIVGLVKSLGEPLALEEAFKKYGTLTESKDRYITTNLMEDFDLGEDDVMVVVEDKHMIYDAKGETVILLKKNESYQDKMMKNLYYTGIVTKEKLGDVREPKEDDLKYEGKKTPFNRAKVTKIVK